MRQPLLLTLFFLFFACQKEDPSPCSLLVNSWRCISWLENEQERMAPGGTISSVVCRMEPLGSDGQGRFNWTALYTSGGTEIFEGKYSVDASCALIRFTPTGQTSFSLASVVEKKKWSLEGSLNGKQVRIVWEPY